MERSQNVQVIGKRIWSVVRVVFFMLRKGLCKRKLLVDLNMMLKRGKIAGGKALNNLIHHHHHHHYHHHRGHESSFHMAAQQEYEFSCSNTPNYTFPYFHNANSNKRSKNNFLFGCAHAPATLDDNDTATVNAVKVVLEMLNNDKLVEASPALPGFGRSPFVRPLRITDSPFPLKDTDDDSGYVDKAAEEFIQKFYKELKNQKRSMADE